MWRRGEGLRKCLWTVPPTRDGRGQLRDVMGACREHADWVWTSQGDWYRRSDGRVIVYVQSPETGAWAHAPAPAPSVRDLVVTTARAARHGARTP